MRVDFKIHKITYGLLDLMNARIAKFNYFSARITYQVVVLFKFIGTLVLRHGSFKAMLGNQAALKQNVNGIIKCGTAHAVIFLFHLNVQRFNVKVAFVRVYFI